jgi:hypothetical protein
MVVPVSTRASRMGPYVGTGCMRLAQYLQKAVGGGLFLQDHPLSHWHQLEQDSEPPGKFAAVVPGHSEEPVIAQQFEAEDKRSESPCSYNVGTDYSCCIVPWTSRIQCRHEHLPHAHH